MVTLSVENETRKKGVSKSGGKVLVLKKLTPRPMEECEGGDGDSSTARPTWDTGRSIGMQGQKRRRAIGSRNGLAAGVRFTLYLTTVRHGEARKGGKAGLLLSS